jgi:hypothetical protein
MNIVSRSFNALLRSLIPQANPPTAPSSPPPRSSQPQTSASSRSTSSAKHSTSVASSSTDSESLWTRPRSSAKPKPEPPSDSKPETSSRLSVLLETCRNDPDLFNSAVLGRPAYWSRQVEICRSVVDYRQTCVYSGNAIGKDYLVGGIVPWWLWTRPNSLVIVTGPTQTVIGSVTWKEIRRAIANSAVPLKARVTSGVKASPQMVDLGNGWCALGYSTTSVERASGQHAKDLLVIVEEASGVPDEIWHAIDSLKFTRLLAIGNPIRPDGEFVRRIRQADRDRQDGIDPSRGTSAIQIPSTDSPHIGLDQSPFGLADKTWCEAMIRQYGWDSLWVRSHILAEIPVVAADTLLPESWLDWAASQTRPILPPHHPVHGTRRISCDLGEGVGRDSSCVLVRDDLGILECVFGAALGLPEAADLIWRLHHRWNVPEERISYDRVGIGRDFPHHLAARGLLRCVGYAGAATPASSDFANLRSEAAWRLRQRLEPGFPSDPAGPFAAVRPPFAIPAGPFWPRLRDELRVLTYCLHGRQTQLLPKKDWATILGHSPDLADALIQSFAF